MAHVAIYTKDWCPYCDRAKNLLDRRGIPYDEIDITDSVPLQKEAIERSGGRLTVPQIFIDGERT